MLEHFCRLPPFLRHVPLSARYSTYRFQGKLQCLRSYTSVVIVVIVNSARHPSFVIRSPLCRTTTDLTTPSTPPPSSSSDHFYATFAIDFACPRQTVFLRLHERRSLVCSHPTSFTLTTSISTPAYIILIVSVPKSALPPP